MGSEGGRGLGDEVMLVAASVSGTELRDVFLFVGTCVLNFLVGGSCSLSWSGRDEERVRFLGLEAPALPEE